VKQSADEKVIMTQLAWMPVVFPFVTAAKAGTNGSDLKTSAGARRNLLPAQD